MQICNKFNLATYLFLTIGFLLTAFGIVWYTHPSLKHSAHQLFSQTTLIIKSEKSPLYSLWVATPKTSKVYFSIRLFNITNPDAIINGSKPSLKEIGPFVYNVISQKENVQINGSTAFYNNDVKFIFNPRVTRKYQKSAHKQYLKQKQYQEKYTKRYYSLDSIVTVLNVPLIVISMINDNSWLLKNSKIIRPFLKSKDLFIQKTVHEILWGYKDENLENLERLRTKYLTVSKNMNSVSNRVSYNSDRIASGYHSILSIQFLKFYENHVFACLGGAIGIILLVGFL